MATHSSTVAWKIPWSLVGCSPWGHEETWLNGFTFTFHFHALEKEMATHSSVLAWRIPGTGEPGGLPSVGSHRVGHHWSDLAAAAAAIWYLELARSWKHRVCQSSVFLGQPHVNWRVENPWSVISCDTCYVVSYKSLYMCFIFLFTAIAQNSVCLMTHHTSVSTE